MTNQPDPQSLVPQEDQSPENSPEVRSLNSTLNNDTDSSAMYKLPFRHNRGKPPSRYSPDHEEKRAKYPIANYVSTQRLSRPLKAFAYKLSSEHIPRGLKRLKMGSSNKRRNESIGEYEYMETSSIT